RRLQLDQGAEIAGAVLRFDELLIFLVVSRYHGGAYVVFSKALNPGLRALAFTGSYASVIGGSAAAAVVFTREVRLRAAADPAVRRACDELRGRASATLREAYECALADATRDAQVAVAAEFDRVHTVERACRMGSLDGIIDPAATRSTLIRLLHEDRAGSILPRYFSLVSPRERHHQVRNTGSCAPWRHRRGERCSMRSANPAGRCQMAEVNGGALLARCLANEGVRFVFGLPSPEIDPLFAALEEHGIRLVPLRHESAGAHIAEGLYKTTRQVAVVIGNPGPGSANLVRAGITPRHECLPIVSRTS